MFHKLSRKIFSAPILLFPLFFFFIISSSYGMTPEELEQKISAAVKSPVLPKNDIWKSLPTFLDQRHVTIMLRGNFSKKSKGELVIEDAARGLVGGSLTGAGMGLLSFFSSSSESLSSRFGIFVTLVGMGAVDGIIGGLIQGNCRSFPFFINYPRMQAATEVTAGMLSSMGLTGLFISSVSNREEKASNFIGGMFFGFLNSVVGAWWINKNHIPDYSSLTEEDREAVLKTYLYSEKPDLVDALETAEKGSPLEVHNMQVPAPLRQVNTRPTALVLYQGPLKEFLVVSAFNGSELAYTLEDNVTLRTDTAALLNKMNEGLSGAPWLGMQCFDVVTGNYGRYQGGKRSVAFLGTVWKKQPAVITWARPQGHPGLILVAFKGTNFASHADQISDTKFFPKDLGGKGQVHSGFCDIADSGIDSLSQTLPTICQTLQQGNQGVQILFTGHSMGAAVALISAFKEILGKGSNADNRRNEALVMNFGQPRVCARGSEGAFQALLQEDNLIRFVATDKEGRKDPIAGYRENEKDSFGYKHFGHEVLLRSPQQVRTTLIGGATSIHPLSSYRKGWTNSLQ